MNIPSKKSFGTKLLFNTLFVLVSMFMTAAFVHAQQQCANGAFGGPVTACDYQNGNLNGNNSQWAENQFVPYRATKTGLTVGNSYTFVIDYDSTVSSGKHGIDYLGSYNTTQTNGYIPGTNTIDLVNYPDEGNNPCGPLAGCTLGSASFFPIPLDPNVTAAINPAFPQIGGQFFTIFGGTITSVSAYTLSGTYANASNTSITVTFTANQANVMLAWSGHIAARVSWGALNSAVAVQGSPYHMSINGNANRSMKVEAEGFPAKLLIRKEVAIFGSPGNVSSEGFIFTSSFGDPFTLYDDGVGLPPPNDTTPDFMVFDFPLAVGETTTANVNELLPPGGWQILNIACTDADGGLGTTANSLPQPGTYGQIPPNPVGFPLNQATANMNEAELVSCVFTNGRSQPTAADVSAEGRVATAKGVGLAGITVKLTNATTGAVTTTTSDASGNFIFEGLEVGNLYVVTGASKGYSYTQQQFVPNDNVTGLSIIASTATKGGR